MTAADRPSRKITGGFVMVPSILLRDTTADALSGNAILTFASLLTFADYDTGEAYPAHESIGERARLSVASVKRALRELTTAGLVTVERQGANKPNRYWVEFTYTSRPADSSHGPAGEVTVSQGDSSERATNDIQLTDNQLTTGVPTAPSSDSADVIDRLVALWIKVTPGRDGARITDNRRRTLRARLRTFSPQDVARAIDEASRSRFHNGENDDGKLYNDLTTTLSNDEKLEGWLVARRQRFAAVASGAPAPGQPSGVSQAARRRAADVDGTIGALDEMIQRAERNGGNL
jgi:hypothetical protein